MYKQPEPFFTTFYSCWPLLSHTFQAKWSINWLTKKDLDEALTDCQWASIQRGDKTTFWGVTGVWQLGWWFNLGSYFFILSLQTTHLSISK